MVCNKHWIAWWDAVPVFGGSRCTMTVLHFSFKEAPVSPLHAAPAPVSGVLLVSHTLHKLQHH